MNTLRKKLGTHSSHTSLFKSQDQHCHQSLLPALSTHSVTKCLTQVSDTMSTNISMSWQVDKMSATWASVGIVANILEFSSIGHLHSLVNEGPKFAINICVASFTFQLVCLLREVRYILFLEKEGIPTEALELYSRSEALHVGWQTSSSDFSISYPQWFINIFIASMIITRDSVILHEYCMQEI